MLVLEQGARLNVFPTDSAFVVRVYQAPAGSHVRRSAVGRSVAKRLCITTSAPLLAVLIIKVLLPMLADMPAAAPQATVVVAYGPYNTCRCCLSFSALPCLPLMLIAASQAKVSAKRATQLRRCCLSFCTIPCLPHMHAAAL